MSDPEKTCLSCGRRIEWRKKWERNFEAVRYCSQACRRRGVSEQDRRLESTIRQLLAGRGRGATITDADVVSAAAISEGPDQCEAARRAVRRLVAAGEVEIVQRGRVLDPSTAKGPLSIRTVL